MSISDVLARYGILVGCVLITLALLWLGYTVGMAVEALKYSFTQLSESIVSASENLKENLQQLNETLDSFHRLFGGRQWQNDELEKDLNGPTIQKLLQSIDRRLKRLTPEDRPTEQTNLILSPKTSRQS